MINKSDYTGYWNWFISGSGAKPGYRRIINLWIIFHIGVGVLISFIVQANLDIAANTVLLPLVGIFIGFSFAWATIAQALMQSNEIDLLVKHHEGGLAEYIYLYQTAVLVIFITLILWGFAGLSVFDKLWPTTKQCITYTIFKTLLFAFCSMSLRECWHVIDNTHRLLLAKKVLRKAIEQKDQSKKHH